MRSNGKKKERAIHAIQCTSCGCGWRAGIDPESQVYVRRILAQGWGIQLVPDCPGCPCHTGAGVLPNIRVAMSE